LLEKTLFRCTPLDCPEQEVRLKERLEEHIERTEWKLRAEHRILGVHQKNEPPGGAVSRWLFEVGYRFGAASQ